MPDPAAYSELPCPEGPIGAVFTPLRWGRFAVERFGLVQKWLEGASVFDPTMGQGHLLEAMLEAGLARGHALEDLPAGRLYGHELHAAHHAAALQRFRDRYGLDMARNFTQGDILTLAPKPYDLLLANPPWVQFADLPERYKAAVKGLFLEYGLVGRRQDLLLGGSRIDLAALVLQRAIRDFLAPCGEAVAFLPLSLFLNDGAHRHFRNYRIGDVGYALSSLHDFGGESVFGGVSTRYGLAHFVRDRHTSFPIPYFSRQGGAWQESHAGPAFDATDPLSVSEAGAWSGLGAFPPIVVRKQARPRQGVNTGGANALFFFDRLEREGEGLVRAGNRHIGEALLPEKFLHPLLTAQNFRESGGGRPCKWALLPYGPDGKPLAWEAIAAFAELRAYLEAHAHVLKARKGTLMQGAIGRGLWWSLLGVGPYSFAPYKVVWEAYGRRDFRPAIFEGHWQANQSLQAFMPAGSLAEASRIHEALSDGRVARYLGSTRMQGTMAWAQPGRIGKLLAYENGELG
jgi:hypothetical protein